MFNWIRIEVAVQSSVVGKKENIASQNFASVEQFHVFSTLLFEKNKKYELCLA